MKTNIKLRFFANPDSNTLVSDHQALANGMVRYIGRRWDKENNCFAPTLEPHTVPFTHEYVAAAKRGDILCADSETAEKCGIKWTTIVQTEVLPSEEPTEPAKPVVKKGKLY